MKNIPPPKKRMPLFLCHRKTKAQEKLYTGKFVNQKLNPSLKPKLFSPSTLYTSTFDRLVA